MAVALVFAMLIATAPPMLVPSPLATEAWEARRVRAAERARETQGRRLAVLEVRA